VIQGKTLATYFKICPATVEVLNCIITCSPVLNARPVHHLVTSEQALEEGKAMKGRKTMDCLICCPYVYKVDMKGNIVFTHQLINERTPLKD